MAKQITLADLDMLKRIMGMTTSIHDGEALNAMRKANKLLEKYNLNWIEVLNRSVNGVSTVTPAIVDSVVEGNELSVTQQIKRAFDELRGVTMKRSFVDFLQSIEEQFQRNGYLTPDQRRPLFEAVKNHRQNRRRDE